MTKAKPGLLIPGGIIALVIVAVFAFANLGITSSPAPRASFPDVIQIDGLKAFGDLEKPSVPFRHGLHAEAVAKAGQDCSACHLQDKDRKLVPKFKRMTDESRDKAMEVYHLNCIECHNEALSAKAKSGPVTCGECHTGRTKVTSSAVKLDFDRSLHFRHVKAEENKCEACHHEYDPKDDSKVVYLKGRESSCRYCHQAEPTEKVRSMRQAAHDDCISCHQAKAAAKIKSGPADCAGCHDAEKVAAIDQAEKIERLDRGQPDTTFVSSGITKEGQLKMKLVPFDHKAHEGTGESCLTCHHEALDKCSECHTLTGSKEGGFVNLERAMHSLGNDQSCLGCHVSKQAKPECAGCHFKATEAFADKNSCGLCHQGDPELSGTKAELEAAAADLLAANKGRMKLYPDEDIPETVKIDSLADKFRPAEFPHRRIVKELASGLAKSNLASRFHRDPGTLCQGCHHNSPPAKKPPECANCHGRPFNAQKPAMPGLKAAYHQQCMNCHQEMELAKPAATACAECHKEK